MQILQNKDLRKIIGPTMRWKEGDRRFSIILTSDRFLLMNIGFEKLSFNFFFFYFKEITLYFYSLQIIIALSQKFNPLIQFFIKSKSFFHIFIDIV